MYKVSASGAGTPLAWYPAPGFRNSASGALGGVGDEGSVRSTSTSGTLGVYLRFMVNAAQPSYGANRAYGIQLRCLSE